MGLMTALNLRQNRVEGLMSRELIPQSPAAFLNLRHLPARLDVEQTAALLGHHPDHIRFSSRASSQTTRQPAEKRRQVVRVSRRARQRARPGMA